MEKYRLYLFMQYNSLNKLFLSGIDVDEQKN